MSRSRSSNKKSPKVEVQDISNVVDRVLKGPPSEGLPRSVGRFVIPSKDTWIGKLFRSQLLQTDEFKQIRKQAEKALADMVALVGEDKTRKNWPTLEPKQPVHQRVPETRRTIFYWMDTTQICAPRIPIGVMPR